jgi:hypothetical protein
MGTRGVYGFRLKGEDKVSYNQYDSYPSGLGQTVVEFIQNTDDKELKRIAKGVVVVSDTAPPLKRHVRECQELGIVDLGVSEQSEGDWYCLVRGAQGEPEYLKKGLRYMYGDPGFLLDGLYCEWAYIINLDDMVLEVYQGFNKDPSAPGRYSFGYENEEDRSYDYRGVRLIEALPLDTVRSVPSELLVARWE